MPKPTKQGGFWSFTGLSILCVIPIIILGAIFLAFFIAPFVDMTTNLYRIISATVSFSVSIAAIFLTVYFYAKIRIITGKFAKRISLIYLIISGFLILIDIVAMLIWSELREPTAREFYPFLLTISIVASLVMYFVMRKLLLRKAEQQEIS